MRIVVFGFSILFLLFLISGCKEETTPPPPETISPPSTLTYITWDDSIKFMWSKAPEHSKDGFLGYSFYSANSPITNATPESLLNTYLLNETPVLDTFHVLRGLTSMYRYYFAVKSVRTIDGQTRYSSLVSANSSPVIIGEDTIWQNGSTVGASSYNFANGMRRWISDTMSLEIPPDIYFDTSSTDQGYALKSPHLLGGVLESQITHIKLLGSGNIDNFPETDDVGWSSIQDASMKVFAIKTVSQNYVKFEITGFGGSSPNRYITFRYKYQNIPNYPHF